MEKKVLELLSDAFPTIDFTASEELVDDGILDSLTLVEIISCLSMEFEIMIPYEEIIPDNFNSVVAIARMIEKLKK
ncbi:MAG: acyl carrier protein [Lachnospiraceae bacterium]|nr:acyl carrier protein [Lachnospiraceae bacterium]